MGRSRRLRLRWVIAGGLVIALAAGALVAWPYVRIYVGTAPPNQFYGDVRLEPALAQDYRHVLRVAHNVGNNPQTLSAAQRYGADVIEIDVISARGGLVAGRSQPWGWLARQVFRGPTLAQAWNGASAAEMVKLDLMQTDRGFLDGLAASWTRAPDPGTCSSPAVTRARCSTCTPGCPTSPCCSAWPGPMRSAN